MSDPNHPNRGELRNLRRADSLRRHQQHLERLDPDERARREVLGMFARMVRHGLAEYPALCDEHHEKVIFDDEAAAKNAADLLLAVGSDPMKVYRCPGNSHYHLTTR